MRPKIKESPRSRKTLGALMLIVAWVVSLWFVHLRLLQIEKIRCQSPGLNWQICDQVLAKKGAHESK